MSKTVLDDTETVSFFKFLPLLVVISTTPLPAREPYRAAALGPFKTLMLSMFSGFKSEMGFPKSTRLSLPTWLMLFSELATGAPSITNRGWLSFTSDLVPRMVIRTDEPAPPEEVMVTPGTRAAKIGRASCRERV